MKLPKWLDALLIRATPPCKEIVRWVSEEVEQPLPWHRRLRMHAHFLICKFCKRYRAQVTTLRTVLRSSSEKLHGCETSEDHLPTDAKQRIKDALRDKSS